MVNPRGHQIELLVMQQKYCLEDPLGDQVPAVALTLTFILLVYLLVLHLQEEALGAAHAPQGPLVEAQAHPCVIIDNATHQKNSYQESPLPTALMETTVLAHLANMQIQSH